MLAHRPFRFGVVAAQARSADEWVAKAQHAESLGYATFLIPDTLGPTFAPLPALAIAAAATRSIRLGTFVLANDFRNPVLLARECATLDFLSGGRLELGLGAGRPGAEDDNRALGIAFDSGAVRVERLAEALGIVKALFSGLPVQAGQHYATAGAQIFPQPVQQPRPPILIAGGGKRLLSLAAQEADIVTFAVRPDAGEAVFKEKIEWLRQAAGERFPQLELNLNLIAAGQELPQWLPARMGLDPAQLVKSGSLAVLMGTVEEMCAQLLARREALGITYVTLADALMDTFAPVVERLAGR
jgi:probable F420-dependent oxidoreductase